MCNLLVELIAVGLRRKPVPIKMLELLTLVSLGLNWLYQSHEEYCIDSYLIFTVYSIAYTYYHIRFIYIPSRHL